MQYHAAVVMDGLSLFGKNGNRDAPASKKNKSSGVNICENDDNQPIPYVHDILIMLLNLCIF